MLLKRIVTSPPLSLSGLAKWDKLLKTSTCPSSQLKVSITLLNLIDNLKELKRFTYFFFAPTLIYRDTYARNKTFRLQVFLKNVFTCLVLVLYLWTVFKAMCIPVFKHTAENPGSLHQFITSVIFSTVSGIICLLTLFYGVLHSWMNVFAEIITFGDRQFYEDWWNVKDFAGYYRKWNIIVHEFLYHYIF